MNRSFAHALGAGIFTLLFHHPLAAQVSLQPTPPPTVTAENEAWYSSGAPVTFAGIVYYPAGPVTHFLRNEMVRTGIVGSVPVYARTTQEPGSVIYVPLAGGVMKPYERRRAGDLAGTVGSSAPSFRVVLASEETPQASALTPAGIPVPANSMEDVPATTPDFDESAAAALPPPVGTTGVVSEAPAPVRTRIETAQRPIGLNTVFVDFENTRWFADGATVEFTAARFTRVGEHHGFDVYQENGRPGTIFLSLLEGAPGLLAPYKKR